VTARPTLSEPQLLRLKDLFDQAVETDPRLVDDFIRTSVSGDPLLERELYTLLDAHSRSSSYFERLAEEMVSDALSALDLTDYDEPAIDETTIRHYEVLDRIGGGGMGVVFKARDTRLGRTVALKFLPPRYASSTAARARLLAEARAASALDHPNIGVVHEVAETEDGRPFIAMAWYDGETLKARARSGQMSLAEAATIGQQLASALDAAHSAGVIHRDVKPANVMITRAGVAKLVDFGIAKFQSADDGESHAAAGTIAYMSPEQTRAEPLDARTDIWSLGVLLYEIIAGQRPFRGTTDADIIAAIQNETLAELSSLRPDTDSRLSAIVATCLSKNPAKRYATAGELSRALADWNLAPGAGSDVTSNPRRFVVAAVAVTALAAGSWGYAKLAGAVGGEGLTGREMSVAVLPFVDSSGHDSVKYLATGLSDAVRAEVSRVPTFRVPSFDGTLTYSRSDKPLTQISAELTADYLITGAVSTGAAGTELRLNLVDGKSGKPVWNTTLDATSRALPRTAREAAKALFDELDVRLDDANRKRLEQPATTNPLAYDLYLRGRHAELFAAPRTMLGSVSSDSLRRAQALYAQAKTLDPEFVIARAQLAVAHMATATASDTSTTRREQARVEAQVALRADSVIPDAYDALATYWLRSGNRDQQVETLERALALMPNNPELLARLATAYVTASRWEDGIAMYDKAISVDPRNPRVLFAAAATFGRLRRQDRGMPLFNRFLEIEPNDHEVRLIRGQSWLRWKGTADTLIAAANAIPKDWDERGMATFARYTALRAQRRNREILEMLDRSKSDISTDGLVYHTKSLMRAEAYHGLGNVTEAARYYEIARVELLKQSAAAPTNAAIHSALGLAYAGLGRKKEAIASAQRAMELVPLTATAYRGAAYMGLAVEILARVGEVDRAFEMIDLMLTMPTGREITIPYLRVWPSFDPLRKDPRFDEVIRRYAAMYTP
jgi:serine/threonine protein kinase/Flp pilus assembly protein TadD